MKALSASIYCNCTNREVWHAGLLHLQALARLCWDERHVKLPTKDDEELWRLVFRRSGMGRLEFKQALMLGRHDLSAFMC